MVPDGLGPLVRLARRTAGGASVAHRADACQRHVAGALRGPLVGLLQQERTHQPHHGGLVGEYGTPLAAFVGALLIALLVLRVAQHKGRVLIASMLLAGIVFNALTGAATSALVFAANDLQLRDILFWPMAVAPAELPIGLLTALLGGPLSLALLLRQRLVLDGR
jgi:ABC-type Fe3+-siderophore transport system permease subunit